MGSLNERQAGAAGKPSLGLVRSVQRIVHTIQTVPLSHTAQTGGRGRTPHAPAALPHTVRSFYTDLLC